MLRKPEPIRTQLWERQWVHPHLDAALDALSLSQHTPPGQVNSGAVSSSFLQETSVTAQDPVPLPRHRLLCPQQELAFQDLS